MAGIGLMMAIFFLTVLSAAGLFLANQLNDSNTGSDYQINISRTYYAAYSGLEWGIYSALNALPCGSIAAPTLLTSFSSYGVTLQVSCTTKSYTEGSSTVNLTNIQSLAQFSTFPSLDYVQRQMTVTIQH